MHDWDLLLTNARIATLCDGELAFGAIDDAALAVRNGVICWIGPQSELPHANAVDTRSLDGRWMTPALIDCHTHLIFGGDRSLEFEQRLQGTPYEVIAKAGGGIMSTVRATRVASDEELLQSAARRLRELAADGVATVEIKSGYGLDVKNEIRLLELARQLGTTTPLRVRVTLLAAHAVPPEFAGNADAYIDIICNELLPEVAARGLADAVDAYHETIAFDTKQVTRVFERAADLGLPVKLHADQLHDNGGASLAADFKALSADHLEYTSATGVNALAASGTVAVLLPGALLTLQETQKPPVDELRKAGVPIALASDCNPGTSPLSSLCQVMALGSRLFGLTPEECLAGVTRTAARALGLHSTIGTLETGKRADLAIWDIRHPRDLSYWMGGRPLQELMIGGQQVDVG